MKYLSAVLGALAALTAFAYAGFSADFSAAFLGSSFSLFGIAMLVATAAQAGKSTATRLISRLTGADVAVTSAVVAAETEAAQNGLDVALTTM